MGLTTLPNTDVTRVQLAIVSQESLANLIPLLQQTPDYTVLIASDHFASKAEPLKKVICDLELLREDQIEIRHGFPTGPFADLQERALHLENELRQRFPNAVLRYNATGGTKLMALAFADVFRGPQHEIVYCDTSNDTLDVVYPSTLPTEPLKNVLDTRTTLKAMGKTIRSIESDDLDWQARALARKQQTYWLVETVSHQEQNIGALNAAIHNATHDISIIDNTPVRLKYPPKQSMQQLLDNFATAGVLHWNDGHHTLLMLDEQAKVYLTGGWLEEYVWLEARQAGANEVYCGVSFTDDQFRKQNIRNEMDLIVQHHNRLLFVECKTSRFGRDELADSGIIYKLDSLSSQAGIFCHGVLVTARPLNHDTRTGYKVRNEERARSHKLYPVAAEDIRGFRDLIRKWMNDGYLPRN